MSEQENYYYKYSFTSDEVNNLVAILNELPFNGFEMEGQRKVHGYIDAIHHTEEFSQQLNDIKIDFSHTTQKIVSENWNQTWENDFEPVIVDDFCVVRADFHPQNNNAKYEIVITPQMSFGTGHHETTRGMIKMMRELEFEGKNVLDFGCGTGVLAILSSKLGAKTVLGVDIEHNAYVNSIDNCQRNEVVNVEIKQGDLTQTGETYDIILANINRHVILDTLPSLSSKLTLGNKLLISGILHSDLPLLEKHLKMASFNVLNAQQYNDWMCILTEKV